MSMINKDIIRSLYENYINRKKIDSLGDIISEQYIDLVSGKKGLKSYQENIESLVKGFPDIEFQIEELLSEGDKVVARWQWQGTHQGHFAKVAATGRKVTNTGVVIFTLKENKVIASWALVDRLSVMQQLG